MQGQNQAIRVSAVRGFYAHRQGSFGVVNPGDVVDLQSPSDAKMLRAAGKVVFVDEKTAINLQTDYLPARKKVATYGKSPAEVQIEVLTKAVEGLGSASKQQAEMLAKQSELITKLLEREIDAKGKAKT